MLVCIAVFIWIIAVSASDAGDDLITTVDTVGEIFESESEASNTEGVSEEITEEITEIVEDTACADTFCEETELAESETLTPIPEVVEVDLSLAERGDGYIINYTDKIVDIAGLLDRGFVDSEERNSSAPVVMILHTHTSEGYYKGKNEFLDGVISVGEVLSARLNALGLTALHCTVIHDGGESNAYISARETIEMMLKVYPTIKYVIDLHRIELDTGGVPIKTLSSEGLAQIRLTVSASGDGWQENLSLALSLRQKLNDNDARLCMPPVLSSSRYNSDLSLYYLMVDIGATGNTVKEARNSAKKLARAIYDTVAEK